MILSVIVPSIRPGNLKHLYDSIGDAFSGEFEMIVVSPYALPRSLENTKNVVLIKDYGTPVRAQQIGLTKCRGEFVSWAADDGVYLPGTIDIAMKSLEGKDYKNLVVAKYNEGAINPQMDDIKYYYLSTHAGSQCRYLPQDCLMLMVAIIPRYLLIEVGGWDCQFEACPMAYNDLSIRLYNYKVNFIFQKEMMFKCSHMPGILGDHAPIHNAQTYHDTPMFKLIYNREDSKNRVKIDLNNWQSSPEVWKRRFVDITI